MNEFPNSNGHTSTLKPDVPEFIPKQLHNVTHTATSTNLSECNVVNGENMYVNKYHIECQTSNSETEEQRSQRAASTQTSSLGNIENVNENKMDSDDLKLIAAKLIENEYLQERVNTLEEQIKAQHEEAKQNDRKQIKLEVQLEELEKVLGKLEFTNGLNQRKIKYLESTLMEQCTRFLSSEKHRTAKNVSKCTHMLADLNLAMHYFTPSSIPSAEECLKSIHEWETQLRIERNYSQTIEEYSRFVFNALQTDQNFPYLNQPQLHMNINDLRDILHDSFIPSISYFIAKQKQAQSDHSVRYPPPMWYGAHHQPPQGVMVPRPHNNSALQGPPAYSPPSMPTQLAIVSSNKGGAPISYVGSYTQNSNNVESNKICENDGVTIETVEEIELEQRSETDIVDATKINTEKVAIEDEKKHDESLAQNSTKEDLELIQTDHVPAEVSAVNPDALNKNNSDEESLSRCIELNESEGKNVISQSEQLCSETKENNVTNSKLEINKENIQAVCRPKFVNLLGYIRQRIPDVNDENILLALKKVRERKVKLSGMTKESILMAVTDELKRSSGNDSTSNAINQQSDESQTMCAICLYPYNENSRVLLKCKHCFHNECIRTWFKSNNVCPICRVHTVPDEEFVS